MLYLLLGIIIGILLTFISIYVGVVLSKKNILNQAIDKVNQITREPGYLFNEDKLEEELDSLPKDNKTEI